MRTSAPTPMTIMSIASRARFVGPHLAQREQHCLCEQTDDDHATPAVEESRSQRRGRVGGNVRHLRRGDGHAIEELAVDRIVVFREVRDDAPVFQTHDAIRVPRDVLLVGHDDDGLAVIVQLLEEPR